MILLSFFIIQGPWDIISYMTLNSRKTKDTDGEMTRNGVMSYDL